MTSKQTAPDLELFCLHMLFLSENFGSVSGRVNPWYTIGFFLLVRYNKLGIVHCTNLGVSGNGIARTLKKVTHIKGRIQDQAVILFNCVLFHDGNFS